MSNSGDENNTGDVEGEDPYAVVSETAEDEDEFVKVMESEDGDSFVELPKEDDGTIMLSTLQGQFPDAAGLKYKSSSGAWRGVRITGDALKPPQGGWGDTKYYVTLQKTGSAKTNSTTSRHKHDTEQSDEPTDEELLQDLFVIRLPREAKDDDLKEYFTTNCGEMDLHEVKFDRRTGKAKGYGFIRFKTADSAREALNGEHVLKGQKIEVRVSRKKQIPCQLFVGRLPEGSTKEDLNEYFSQYGEVTEAYITSPFRGFGFVTFASTDIARSILRLKHEIKGQSLNVAVAKPKEENGGPRGRSGSRRNDDYRGGDSRRRDYGDTRDRSRHDRRDNSRYSRYDSPPRSHESVNDLKRIIFDMINQRR